MSPAARHQWIEELFHIALEQGEAALTQATSDPEVLHEVRDLLYSYRQWSATLPAPSLPRFGPYQSEVILGSGGMGTVYRARRADGQFTQLVAIKVLRGSLRSEWFHRRFLAEREILARLNHPAIARLLDGGMTDQGEPYLVMELVEGEPIDVHCRQRRLSTAQILPLFLQLLDAVDYAHRNLTIHRDLKPSNILVTPAGQVKLVDFGTSRLITDDSLPTLHAMTPRYASPEQARREPTTVATDVYSAGVVLSELLGSPVPRDLQTIVRKAMEDDPARRYSSARECSADLTRFQNGQPVLARPQTAAYRIGRFLHRHPWQVLAASLAIIAIVTLAAVSTSRSLRLARELESNRLTLRFLQDVLGRGTPYQFGAAPQTKRPDVTVREALREASPLLDSLPLSPSTALRLRYWLALAQSSNETETADLHTAHLLRNAIDAESRAMADHLEARQAHRRNDFPTAIHAAERALAYCREDACIEYPAKAVVLLDLARIQKNFKQDTAAMQNAQLAAALAERQFGPSHSFTIQAQLEVGEGLRRQGKYADSESLVHRIIDAQTSLPSPPYELAGAYQLLALLCGHHPKREGELEAWRNAESVLRRHLPPGEVTCSYIHNNHLMARARDAKDRTTLREIEEIARTCKAADPSVALNFAMSRAFAYRLFNEYDEAEAAARQALSIANTWPRGVGWICWAENELANVLLARRARLDEARTLFESARAEYLQVYGPVKNVSVSRIDDSLAKLKAIRNSRH